MKDMEIMLIEHYSYKLMQRVEIKLPGKSLEYAKSFIDSFIKKDKKSPFLTFVEYYIFCVDSEGYKTRYYKELDLGKNVNKTLDNIEVIYNWLKLMEKESNKRNKNIKISVHKKD